MAAAIIPLIGTVAPVLIKFIAGLVHKSAQTAEIQYGPSTGPVKFASVLADVNAALQAASNAGQIPKIPPDPGTVQTIIQAVVTSMQLSGLLGAPAVPAPAPAPATAIPQRFTLLSGQTITIVAS